MIATLNDGLVIRELTERDATRLFELMNRPEVQAFLPDRFDSLDEMGEVIGWLRGNYGKAEYIRLTYAVSDGDALVGWVSAGPLPSDESRRELAYCVHPDRWGRGIATSAARAFIDWLRAADLAGELDAEVHTDNAASIKVLESCGFVRSGAFADRESGASKFLYRLQPLPSGT